MIASQTRTSSVYRCTTCGQSFSKIGNGAMGLFKRHLDRHPANRRMFKIVAGVNSNPNSNANKELDKEE